MAQGYLLILIHSALMCAMSALRKEYQRHSGATLRSTLSFMLTSSSFVCLIGVIFCFATDFSLIRQADALTVGLAALFAIILTVNTCLCIFGAKYGSLAMVTTFATLGTLVLSTIFGLLSDPVANKLNAFNILGLCLALAIVALSFVAQRKDQPESGNAEKGESKKFIFICLAVFLFNGSALSVYSTFTSNRASYGGFNFIFLYLFFCTVLCGATLAVLRAKRKQLPINAAKKLRTNKASVICALSYGVVFFGSEFCALTTTSILPIVVQAPLSFAVSVLTVALVDFFVYRQRLTKIQLIQIGLALISGICFAV